MGKCEAYEDNKKCEDEAIGKFQVRTKEVLIPISNITVEVPLCELHNSCLIQKDVTVKKCPKCEGDMKVRGLVIECQNCNHMESL